MLSARNGKQGPFYMKPTGIKQRAREPASSFHSQVFISYSRKDIVFAERICAELQSLDFRAYLDKNDISPGEPWEQRLGALIASADSVVFLLSPDSVISKVCVWEVDEAERLSKRVLPVICKHTDPALIPGRLCRLNWISFSDGTKHEDALAVLTEALLTDIAWLREQTRLVAMAAHWAQAGRRVDQLMTLADLRAADQLFANRPANVDAPPSILIDYRDASRARQEEDDRKQRRIIGRAFVKPADAALTDGEREHSLRLAAAGVLLAKDPGFDLVPELWPPIERAIMAHRTRVILEGHSDTVNLARFSPDGRLIATAADDNSTRIWAFPSGNQIALLDNHSDYVQTAEFSVDGQRLVTASNDMTARVWDTSNWQPIGILGGHRDRIWSANFSVDRKFIVTASDDQTARIWDATTMRELATLVGHEGPVLGASFSSDGLLIVTSSADKSARLWDAISGKPLGVLGAHEDRVCNASFDPAGHHVVTGCSDFKARVWRVADNRLTATLTGHEGWVITSMFSAQGDRIVTASEDRSARVWDASTGRQIAVLNGHRGVVTSASFSRDGRWIATSSVDAKTRIWELSQLTGIRFSKDVALSAALADGVGMKSKEERTDLLMQDAPQDLFAEALRQFGLRDDDPELQNAKAAFSLRALDSTNGYDVENANNPYKDTRTRIDTSMQSDREWNISADTIASAVFRETRNGVHLFDLPDGRVCVLAHLILSNLQSARATADAFGAEQIATDLA